MLPRREWALLRHLELVVHMSMRLHVEENIADRKYVRSELSSLFLMNYLPDHLPAEGY